MRKKRSMETAAARGGAEPEKRSGPLAPPVVQSATFQAADLAAQQRLVDGDEYYTRYGNPTHVAAEQTIAELEGAEAAVIFASGMAAITGALLAFTRAGEHLVCQRDIYGGTSLFLNHWAPRFGLEVTFVETTAPQEFQQAIRPNTRVLYLETPTNPTLKLVDLGRMAELARARGLVTMVDSTFATPLNQRPGEHGIDVVLHSATKYLGGHSDIVAGAAAGSREHMQRLREVRIVLGGCMDPHASYLLLRGLRTLAVRVERQNRTALRLAQFLERHPAVRSVHYPLLESHPQRDLARAQMRGGGGVLSFEVDGGVEEARRVVESLRLFTIAPSLGGVESLVTIPVMTSHIQLSAEDRRKTGVSESLVRLAVGLEAEEELEADLEQALSVVGWIHSGVAEARRKA